MMDMLKYMNHSIKSLFISTPYSLTPSDTNIVLFHKLDSLLETTMQIKRGTPQSRPGFYSCGNKNPTNN